MQVATTRLSFGMQTAITAKFPSTPKFMGEFLGKKRSHQQFKFTSSTKTRVNSLFCFLFVLRESQVYHCCALAKGPL